MYIRVSHMCVRIRVYTCVYMFVEKVCLCVCVCVWRFYVWNRSQTCKMMKDHVE